jgi:hypothetical protein
MICWRTSRDQLQLDRVHALHELTSSHSFVRSASCFLCTSLMVLGVVWGGREAGRPRQLEDPRCLSVSSVVAHYRFEFSFVSLFSIDQLVSLPCAYQVASTDSLPSLPLSPSPPSESGSIYVSLAPRRAKKFLH